MAASRVCPATAAAAVALSLTALKRPFHWLMAAPALGGRASLPRRTLETRQRVQRHPGLHSISLKVAHTTLQLQSDFSTSAHLENQRFNTRRIFSFAFSHTTHDDNIAEPPFDKQRSLMHSIATP